MTKSIIFITKFLSSKLDPGTFSVTVALTNHEIDVLHIDKPRGYYDFFSGYLSILMQKVFQGAIDLFTKQSRVKN